MRFRVESIKSFGAQALGLRRASEPAFESIVDHVRREATVEYLGTDHTHPRLYERLEGAGELRPPLEREEPLVIELHPPGTGVAPGGRREARPSTPYLEVGRHRAQNLERARPGVRVRPQGLQVVADPGDGDLTDRPPPRGVLAERLGDVAEFLEPTPSAVKHTVAEHVDPPARRKPGRPCERLDAPACSVLCGNQRP